MKSAVFSDAISRIVETCINILEELLRPSSTWRISAEVSLDTLTNTMQPFQHEYKL